ncbi:MAG: hypothetical protein FJX34_05050, partial [Alphaproteobacteria bacterium]|nr:hypothetical protein [Alphaproteobacteria bacterium]
MRSRFFDKKFEFLTIAQVLDITGARLVGDCDTAQRISDVATLEKATFSEISFVNSGQYLEKFLNSKVGFCLLEEKYASKAPQGMVALIHKNPYFAYAQIAASFYQVKKPNFSTTSNAKIGEGTVVAPNAYVGNDVEIGKNCVIAPGASIMEGCVIGDGCVINANATVSFAMIGKNSV